MKQELKDIGIELAMRTAPAGGVSWWAYVRSNVSVTAVLTCALLLLQIVYLLRKWWRDETEWGLKLRAWAEKHHLTKPTPLSGPESRHDL